MCFDGIYGPKSSWIHRQVHCPSHGCFPMPQFSASTRVGSVDDGNIEINRTVCSTLLKWLSLISLIIVLRKMSHGSTLILILAIGCLAWISTLNKLLSLQSIELTFADQCFLFSPSNNSILNQLQQSLFWCNLSTAKLSWMGSDLIIPILIIWMPRTILPVPT